MEENGANGNAGNVEQVENQKVSSRSSQTPKAKSSGSDGFNREPVKILGKSLRKWYIELKIFDFDFERF